MDGWLLLVLVGVGLVAWRAIKAAKVERDDAARKRSQDEHQERLRTPGTPEWTARQARLEALAKKERATHEAQLAREQEKLERVQQARREGRYVTDWRSAEKAAEWIMRERLGFKRVEGTGAGADRGIDVIAGGACAQVKYQSAKVGRPDVQRLKGAAAERTAIFIAFGAEPYAKPAIEWADEAKVALFAIDESGEPTAINAHAATYDVRSRETAERAEAARAKHSSRGAKPGDRCARCDDGVRVVRHRRSDGGSFLGCSGYPKCRNASPYRQRRHR